MTGYAKVQCNCGTKKYNIEIKTLNSKQLDLIVKMPPSLRQHELQVRAMLGMLERGKVECIVSEEGGAATANMNTRLLAARYNALKALADSLGANDGNLLASIATMNDVWEATEGADTADTDWEAFEASLKQAIDQCDEFRSHEGGVLEADFALHVDRIEQMLAEIPQHEQERITTAKERIRKWMADAEIKEVDRNRFEQELIYYLEKLDITEEKVRLQKHIDYFRQTMANEPVCGKKLGFVAQEMGREINTTGSKANHVEIQRLVVVMKDELEKIKEQLGNVL